MPLADGPNLPTSGAMTYSTGRTSHAGGQAELCGEGCLERAQFDVHAAIASRRVTVAGDLDVATCPTLAATLETLLDADGSGIAIDMAAVSFIDCAALAVLVHASNQLAATGGRVLIVEPSPSTLRLLRLTGLSETFSTTRSDAGS
jgi:anti-sigma B factor antagonist